MINYVKETCNIGKISTKGYLGFYSIIIFLIDFLCKLFEGSDGQIPVFAFDGTIVRISHHCHNLFLSAPFEGGLIISSIAEVALVDLSHLLALFLRESVEALGCILSKEVVAVEKPVSPDEGSSHPDGSESTEPPNVGFHNEVGVVKHRLFIISNILYDNEVRS